MFIYDLKKKNVRGFMKNFILLSERNKQEILDYLPNENVTLKLANFFQNFSDTTRLKIITCLTMSDMCVNDISNLLNINQTTVSHQLKILRAQNIVNFKRNGKIILYSLASKNVNDMMLYGVNSLGWVFNLIDTHIYRVV